MAQGGAGRERIPDGPGGAVIAAADRFPIFLF